MDARTLSALRELLQYVPYVRKHCLRFAAFRIAVLLDSAQAVQHRLKSDFEFGGSKFPRRVGVRSFHAQPDERRRTYTT